MSLDSITNESIRAEVEEAGQSSNLANKIIAWVSEISSGNESQDDSESAFHRAELIYDDTVLYYDEESEGD